MHFLITAGPTREPLDPVRYLTNRSSGKMGYALAQAAAHAGHRVTLVSGPTNLHLPHGVDFVPVLTAQDMFEAVGSRIGSADAAIMAAAVADYRPAEAFPEKMKKGAERIAIEFVRTPDILGSARGTFGFRGVLAGFAAETENVRENARAKLERKGCDLICANDVAQPGIGFDAEENALLLLFKDGAEHALEKAPKEDLAREIIEICERLAEPG